MSIAVTDITFDRARAAWLRLRDELEAILGEDLVAMWAHGGTLATDPRPQPIDLDTYVILSRAPAPQTAEAIKSAEQAAAAGTGAEWDSWYVTLDHARRPEPPPHAFRERSRDTAWAINRAHWLAGKYALLHGLEPGEIVPVPTWPELQADLDRELEHIERHVAERDTNPYEATYAVLNGSRILQSLATGNVAASKRTGGAWALEHLPARWHPALQSALRSYDGTSTADDVVHLATEMAPFVAMVREHLPSAEDREPGALPRWSGY